MQNEKSNLSLNMTVVARFNQKFPQFHQKYYITQSKEKKKKKTYIVVFLIQYCILIVYSHQPPEGRSPFRKDSSGVYVCVLYHHILLAQHNGQTSLEGLIFFVILLLPLPRVSFEKNDTQGKAPLDCFLELKKNLQYI